MCEHLHVQYITREVSILQQVWSSLLYLVINTSLGMGCAVGTIIPQYEIAALVKGLRILDGWNLVWNPKLFMMDKSSQEQGAVHTPLSDLNVISIEHKTVMNDHDG